MALTAKQILIRSLERMIVNVRDLIAALEDDDLPTAQAKIATISQRLDETADELRSAA